MRPTPVDRVAAAVTLAALDAQGEPRPPRPEGPYARKVAVGDPQCPLPVFLEVLDRHGLLDDHGQLAEDVRLLSIGDHFDWGGVEHLEEASEGGWHLLAWLAAHPPEQVVLLAGNHDLARVGELAGLDARRHRTAVARASEAYRDGETDPAKEAAFLADFPEYPSAEVAARDLSAFRVEQRELVVRLLRQRRLRAAEALADRVVAVHAGVAMDHLRYLDLPGSHCGHAPAVAECLNRALAAAADSWEGGAMHVDGLHRPGSAARGEGGGVFYHRPAHPDRVPEDPPVDELGPDVHPTLRRVFDARRLPFGLTQVVGHVRDYRCRDLLGAWAEPGEPVDGPLRHLRCDGEVGRYAVGIPAVRAPKEAHMIFLDSGMNFTDPARVELLDIERLAPLAKP